MFTDAQQDRIEAAQFEQEERQRWFDRCACPKCGSDEYGAPSEEANHMECLDCGHTSDPNRP